jgi:hypothetical protein
MAALEQNFLFAQRWLLGRASLYPQQRHFGFIEIARNQKGQGGSGGTMCFVLFCKSRMFFQYVFLEVFKTFVNY